MGGGGVESVRECTLALDEGEIGCWELRLDVKRKVRILEKGREFYRECQGWCTYVKVVEDPQIIRRGRVGLEK